MMINLLCFAVGFIICYVMGAYQRYKLVMQLQKVAAQPKLDEMYKNGICYSIEQIERVI